MGKYYFVILYHFWSKYETILRCDYIIISSHQKLQLLYSVTKVQYRTVWHRSSMIFGDYRKHFVGGKTPLQNYLGLLKDNKRWNSSKMVVHRCFSTQRMFTIIPKYHGGPMSHCTLLDLCPTVRQLQIFDVNIWWCHHILKWSYICSENGTEW